MLRVIRLGQERHTVGNVLYRVLGDRCALAALYQGVRFEARAQRVGPLESGGHRFEHGAIGTADEDADPLQLRQLLADGTEPGDEEVANGDVGAGRAVQHAAQTGQEVRIGQGVEDVQGVTPRGWITRDSCPAYRSRAMKPACSKSRS